VALRFGPGGTISPLAFPETRVEVSDLLRPIVG
jgi:hypothetical protein